jgi:hypothetical protein
MVKTAISEQWIENQDFELIPRDENDWHVRIMKGDFIECVIHYGSIRFDEENAMMHFDFDLVESTDEEYTAETPDLQKTASHILHSILLGALEKETANK